MFAVLPAHNIQALVMLLCAFGGSNNHIKQTAPENAINEQEYRFIASQKIIADLTSSPVPALHSKKCRHREIQMQLPYSPLYLEQLQEKYDHCTQLTVANLPSYYIGFSVDVFGYDQHRSWTN